MAAIYQWFEGVIAYQTLTTTLYPIEASEGITFDVDVNTASMQTINFDEVEHSFDLVSVDRQTILLSTSEGPDEVEHSFDVFSVVRQTILINTTEGPDEVEHSFDLVSVTRQDLLVTCYSPDHGLLMDIDLDSANCSLDPV